MNFEKFIIKSDLTKAKPVPWEDDDFSRRSLELHLDQNHDVNSRRDFIIEQQVAWIHENILNQKQSKILDLACGPGLYTEKFASLGHHCTGFDISPAVIEYAQSKNIPNCQYHCENILDFHINEKYDLVLLNFGWFQNFQPSQAKAILSKISEVLNSGSKLLLELLYFGAVHEFGENIPQWHRAESGIFSDKPYIFLQENIWDEEKAEAKVFYHIFESSEKYQTYIQTYQGYEKDDLFELLTEFGFSELEFHHDLFDDDDFDEDLFFLSATFQK